MRLFIDHVTILTMDPQRRVIENGYVLIEDDHIQKIGAGACEEPFEEHLDGGGMLLMPGMINTHCHVPMVPFRTMGDDCPDRLRRFLFPLELEAMTPELVYAGAKYGIAEMLLSGVTTFLDMYYFEDQVAKACEEMGIRAWLGETVIEMETCDSKEPYGGLAYGEAFIKAWKGHERIVPMIAPHATNTNAPEKLKEAYELAVRYDVPWTMHVSEMDYELKHFRETYDRTPTEFLKDQGMLDDRLIAAHCIHMTDRDLELMKEAGAKISHCIGSNTKAGKGVARVRDMAAQEIPVGLGTDGPSSGNTLDLFTQFRLFASFQKTHYHDRSLFPAKDIVALGTIGGAKVLGASERLGSIEEGKKADLVLVRMDGASMFPCYNPYSLLVYSANASQVDTVLVDGRILVRNRKLVCADFDQIREDLNAQMGSFYEKAEAYRDII